MGKYLTANSKTYVLNGYMDNWTGFRRTEVEAKNDRPPETVWISIAWCLPYQTLEGKVQRHLQESRTADGVLNEPKLTVWRAGISALRADSGIHRHARIFPHVIRRIPEPRIECNVIIRRIEAGVVKDVKGLHIKTEFEALLDSEILK